MIDAGAQEVLERTALIVTSDWVEARLQVGLPAAGRSVLGRQAEAMLCEDLPRIVDQALCWEQSPESVQQEGRDFVDCVENQEHIRQVLEERELVAFVADDAVLPRQSGATDRPLVRQAVAFRSPDSRRITIDVPHPVSGSTKMTGMGIPRGVTLIVGGGYHGKSTLLKALERGIYPHIPGDGREYVVTSPDTVKIRAEDGRRVECVDISPFISNLPYDRSTTAFSTEDASGSTSQAANIMEALESGARVLLLDEDTSATNFMVRDSRMQSLVHKEHEPITPFLDRIRELYDELGVSTVLVMGGCGDYFEVADTVLMMRNYLPREVTEQAKTIAREHPSGRSVEATETTSWTLPRIPRPGSFDPSRGKRDVKIDVKELDSILFGRDRIDLRSVEQLVDRSQTNAVGQAIHLAATRFMDGDATLREVVEQLEAELDREGLDILDPFYRPGRPASSRTRSGLAGSELERRASKTRSGLPERELRGRHPGNFARPRKYEIAAAINRLRTVRMKQKDDRL
jgi:predicted ABC-class ATPase